MPRNFVSPHVENFRFSREKVSSIDGVQAPEVLGGAPYDSRADLWSVGVMMYEMLVGSVPFTGNNIVHLKRVIDTTDAMLAPEMRQQLSPACQVRAQPHSAMRGGCGGLALSAASPVARCRQQARVVARHLPLKHALACAGPSTRTLAKEPVAAAVV